METINHFATDPNDLPGADLRAESLDWSSLRARCAATHSAQIDRITTAKQAAVRTGAFAIWAQPVVHPAQTSRIVNPTGLADGKSTAGMKGHSADLRLAGGQGYL